MTGGPIIINDGKKRKKHGDIIIFAGHGKGISKKHGHGIIRYHIK